MQPYSGPPGTKDKPLEVFSMFDDRIIGCVCKCLIIWCCEDSLVIVKPGEVFFPETRLSVHGLALFR